MVAQGRVVRRFSWHEVDEDLVRAMLIAVYMQADRWDDVRRLENQTGRLTEQAEVSLGRTLLARHMQCVAEILRKQWLPTLDSDALDVLIWDLQLSLTGALRTTQPSTQPARVAFLSARRLTGTFVALLRAAFIRAHKSDVAARPPGRPPGQKPSRQPYVIELDGLGLPDRLEPYPHQVDSWTELDKLAAGLGARRSGLVILPTGAGKTHTLVAWLLEWMQIDSALRVLWIADQQELLEQAATAFGSQAETMPPDFQRRMRVIHGGASPPSTLADPNLDVVCATRQSLVGHGLDETAQRRIEAFLSRPCVVVVDEAHHAVSRTYRDLLTFVQEIASGALLIGMTATPWPSGAGMTELLRERFPVEVANVEVRQLIAAGVLARPVFHTVDTGELVRVNPQELRAMGGGDLPPTLLRRLDAYGRNEVIVKAWVDRQELWGKTLVFACDIDHADRLTDLFRRAGAHATVVHSRAEVERSSVIEAFRRAQGPAVLISVGMLLEGVDVPDARTAFLTRPTSSRILLRQMVGRVLRGVAGGGEATAHVVDFHDNWPTDVAVLAPADLPFLDGNPAVRDEGDEHVLPPILDELTGVPIGEDVLRQIERAYDEKHAVQLPHWQGLAETVLLGFYELGDINVPVFEHALPVWDELIAAERTEQATGARSPLELFDYLPVPRPPRRDVDAVIGFLRSQLVEPPFVSSRSVLSLPAVAHDLLSAAAMTEGERLQWLVHRYESTLARSAYLTFQAFWEALQHELLERSRTLGDPPPPPARPVETGTRDLARIGRRPDRMLEPLLQRTVKQGRAMLRAIGETGYDSQLSSSYVPKVEWTRRPVKSAFAYWAPRISHRNRGQPIIRVNRALQAPLTRVPDELLCCLLWHELCHHLLPGRGHDAEFRRLELLWPHATTLNSDLDTLSERFDLTWADGSR